MEVILITPNKMYVPLVKPTKMYLPPYPQHLQRVRRYREHIDNRSILESPLQHFVLRVKGQHSEPVSAAGEDQQAVVGQERGSH